MNVVEKSDFMPGLCHTIWSIADNFKVVRMSLVYQVSVCRLTRFCKVRRHFTDLFSQRNPTWKVLAIIVSLRGKGKSVIG